MKLDQGKTYWVSNPKHGTQRARLELLSPNQRSLLFLLETPIAVSTAHGIAIASVLPLTKQGAEFCDIGSGAFWTITETEPPVKHPTK